MRCSEVKLYLLAIILVIITLFLTYPSFFIKGDSLFYRDVARGYLPEKIFQSETIRNGHWPFWNPALFSGISHHATLAAEVYYPLNCLFWIKPYHISFTANTFLHLIIGSLGIIFWLKGRKISKFICLLLAIIWPSLGLNIGFIEFFPMIAAIALTPWILGCMERSLKEKTTYKWMGWGGLIFGFQLLINYPTISVYTFIIALQLLLILDISSWKRTLKTLIVIGVIGSLIYSIQLIPTSELLNKSVRHEVMTGADGPQITLQIENLANLLYPTFWFENSSLIMMIGPFLLIGLALSLFYRNLYSSFALAFIWLLASTGNQTLIYKGLASVIFPLKWSRKPININIITVFILIHVAITGWQSFVTCGKKKKKKILKVFVIPFSLLFLLFFILQYFRFDIIALLCSELASENLIRITARKYSMILSMAATGLISLQLALASLYFLVFNSKYFGKIFCLLTAIIMPILVYYNPNPLASTSFFSYKPNITNAFSMGTGKSKVYLTDETIEEKVIPFYASTKFGNLKTLKAWKDTFEYRFPMSYNIYDAKGNGSLMVMDYMRFLFNWDAWDSKHENPNIKLLQAIGVTHLISSRAYKSKLLHKLDYQPVGIYKLLETMPFAGLSYKSVYVEDRKTHLHSVIRSKSFDPLQVVIVDDKSLELNSVATGTVNVIPSSNPNKFIVNYNSEQDAILYLQQKFYPGWKAFENEQEIKLIRVNGWMLAIKAKKGKHQITFKFFPNYFWHALSLSLLGVIIACMLIISNKGNLIKSQ